MPRISIEEALLKGYITKDEAKAMRAAAHPGRAGGGRPRTKLTQTCNEPQAILWRAIKARWPDAEWELAHAVPGRRFKIDIAFSAARLAVELDGWQYHGKYKSDFQKDRERQNLLTLHGWRILRFTAGDVHRDIQAILAQIAAALEPPTAAQG